MRAEIAGTTVHYELTGSGEKRVVLLHGWGCSAALMRSAASALEDGMRVLAVDFPAFGESGRPPEPWGVPEYAACLRELLERLDFLPCSAVAHSFGGRVAIWLASEDPSLFEKLVITGGAGIRKPQTEEGKRRSEAFQRKKKLAEALGRIPLLKGTADRCAEKLRRKYGSADYNALDEEMRKTFVKVISLDLADRLPGIKQPTLLLWGDRDTETPLWMGQRMEREIPDAGLVVLEGGTHFAYLEQAARFNTIVRRFLMGE
ncbi:MAG: alpha/beta hydrolase [Clostridia bacterium]|nr:alpha/beta hydrolase [Clostridia bacterium]